MAIVIVVDGQAGAGDYVFARKLACQLQARYLLEVDIVVREDKVSPLRDRYGFTDLIGHKSYRIDPRSIDFVVEAPVFGPSLRGYSGRESDMLETMNILRLHTPLIMMGEYGCQMTSTLRERYAEEPAEVEIFKTGFADDEIGVLQEVEVDAEREPVSSAVISPCLGLTYGYTQDDFNYYMSVHRIYSKANGYPNANVVALGDKAFGFAQAYADKHRHVTVVNLTDFNWDTTVADAERILDAHIHVATKKILCIESVNTAIMRWLRDRSGAVVGVRGDQSFVEMLSAGKIPVYSCARHKVHFLDSYMAAMKKKLSAADYKCLEDINPLVPEHLKHRVVAGSFPVPRKKLTEPQSVELSEFFSRPARIERVALQQKKLLAEKSLMSALGGLFDRLSLSALVEKKLRNLRSREHIASHIHNFLSEVDRTAPKVRGLFGLFSAKHRAQVDGFVSRVARLCEDPSVDEHALINRFVGELREITRDLLSSKSERTLNCFVGATKLCSPQPAVATPLAGAGAYVT